MLNEECLAGSAVVVGAGTMGGGIAAQLANAGWEVRLLDTTLELATAGLSRVLAAKPPPLFLPEFGGRITPGSTVAHLEVMRDADWVVEAVFEDRAVKQALVAQIEAHAGRQTLVSSNTSGLSLRKMTTHCSAGFRARFLGTHFLNPPRYLKLLEVIPLPETAPDLAAGFVRFAERVLGHRVVLAKDTPGFLSTRVGIWHLLDSLHTALELGLTPEEADFATGPLLGRPRTGTFRLADVIGLDILAAIGRDLYARLPDDPRRDRFGLPAVVERLLAEGRSGDKSGAGFYKRDGRQTLVLDLQTFEYRPRLEVAIEKAETLPRLPLRERVVTLQTYDGRWAEFANTILDAVGQYVTSVGPQIAESRSDIDHTMQWGFGWEIGPCETFSLRHTSFGNTTWQNSTTSVEYRTLRDIKTPVSTVLDMPDGSLVDIGDGAACLEFHTKMNTFSPALSAFVDQARERAERDFAALVIANGARNFSAGYDLGLFLQAAEPEKWDAVEADIKLVQDAFLGLKYARIPIAAAPRGYTLGAGCECVLHCAAVVAAPELAIGLPELTVGALPCGGGCTQMLIRAVADAVPRGDTFPHIERAFDLLTQPRNSANAYDARQQGFLRPEDLIVRNPDRLLAEAKRHALSLAQAGYQPPERQPVRVSGEETLARLRMKIQNRRRAEEMTDHDQLIADKIARVLSGGALPCVQDVSEEYLYALERQGFLELLREPKTTARMRHMVDTGKPLKN